ncbi:hypothetical protein [Muriicola sp. Z0-33]|uniref:hypothetical protein n=1 Tax=Muriicola sp. Z0-33 TaxID=2816957 RepID=UPI0022388082|nr:hypothetical protein [Muriicola sp. Z0-33]MCW5516285.1 hypothetical protein [Muriicola sp. Z0-33]
MATKYLFASRYKTIGLIILIPSVILGLYTLINEWEPLFLDIPVFGLFVDDFTNSESFTGVIDNNILNEILGILIIISSLFVAFSREKDEDELITKIRLESLVWATYWNYGILILSFLLVYDISFYWVMVFNMFTILILFIVKFNLKLWSLRKATSYEE